MRDTAFKITPSMNARLAKIHARTADDSLEPMDLVWLTRSIGSM